MAVTLREVAAAAGVSTAAVSKVLHGRGDSVRVSDSRAEEIRQVAERLNYRPNAVARNLRTRKSNAVGLIFENFGSISGGPQYYVELLDGVSEVVFREHYRLTILPEIPHRNILGSLGDGQLEGVIWCKLARDEATLGLIHQCPIPVIAMNAIPPDHESEAIFVACDNEGGIELAVEHLWSLGHRKIAHLNEIPEHNTPDCSSRREAFRMAMGRRGVTDPETLTWSWDLEEMGHWWATNPATTAVVCWSESLAGRFIDTARRIGLRIPQNVSVVGFDSTSYSDALSPRLTAVRQPIRQMARCAAESLFTLLQDGVPAAPSYTFPCTFDVRDSTSQPPQR